MSAVEIVRRVVEAFARHNVPYMAVGSFSVNVYAEPRSTRDADFVVQLDQCPIERIAEMLGSDFILERQMSFESITMTTRYKLKRHDGAFSIEIFGLSDDTFDQERFRRRETKMIAGHPVSVPTVEDVIVQKLYWFNRANRRKDIEDATNVILSNAERLDTTYLRRCCEQLGVLDLFEKIYQDALSNPL